MGHDPLKNAERRILEKGQLAGGEKLVHRRELVAAKRRDLESRSFADDAERRTAIQEVIDLEKSLVDDSTTAKQLDALYAKEANARIS